MASGANSSGLLRLQWPRPCYEHTEAILSLEASTSTTAVLRDNNHHTAANATRSRVSARPPLTMPTAASPRTRAADPSHPKDDDNSSSSSSSSSSNSHHHNSIALSPNNPLSQLQQAAHQSATNASNASQNPSTAPSQGHAIDGARNPIAPGTQYTSLRRIIRRQPEDPEHTLDGIDTTHADLSLTAREDGDHVNPATGEPWLYPKKKNHEGSNLVDFKDEIEERTKNGQGYKAIAEALIAKGVDTSSRAVARQRMKWGLRQRVCRPGRLYFPR